MRDGKTQKDGVMERKREVEWRIPKEIEGERDGRIQAEE